MAWAGWTRPPSATWYVVEDLRPLGWHIMAEETSYDRAADWLRRWVPNPGRRVRVMRADVWETATLDSLRQDEPWLTLGEMAKAGNRWREHEYEQRLLTAARYTAVRDPEHPTTGGIPVQHGTGWPVDAPTTPVPGIAVENDPYHVGTRLERALGREDRRRRAARHVRQDATDDDSDGGQ
jgi:hypothetical protein